MGRFNIQVMRYLEPEHFRVLTAVEMGMKNHEVVPLALVAAIANLHRGSVNRALVELMKHDLVAHDRGKQYDGYRLKNLGYDCLALKTLNRRGVVESVGNEIGVGKESDIYIAGDADEEDVVVKLHRLGRTSFRKVKEKRDYLKKASQSCSWLYLSRLAATKEFAFLRALHACDFPVPRPIDHCRHVVVMQFVEGETLCNVDHVDDVDALFNELMEIIVRLARHGLIHCDFNEFNVILCEGRRPVLIDLPQMVSIDHANARFYFDRDVECVRTFFRRRFGFEAEVVPQFADVVRRHHLDVRVAASGFIKPKRKTRKAKNSGEEDLDEKDEVEEIESHEEEDEGETGSGEEDEGDEGQLGEWSEVSERLEETLDDGTDSDESTNSDTHPTPPSTTEKKEKERMSSEEVRRRVIQERTKIARTKLRIKGKASAVNRGRKQNAACIREGQGDSLFD